MIEPGPDRPTIDVAVYGLINAGKSSLINALAGRDVAATGPVGGTTGAVAGLDWTEVDTELGPIRVRLLDTPGLEEVGDSARAGLATEAARRADLVVFVVAEDLTDSALDALAALRVVGKPIVMALNKVDLLGPDEHASILGAIRNRLAGVIPPDDVIPIAAAPIVRERVDEGGTSRVVARRGDPEIGPLLDRLTAAVGESGLDLKELNEARARIEAHTIERDRARAELRPRAERVADETAAGLAMALAVNPIPLIDFLTGPAGLAILVARVSAVYGETPSPEAAKALARELFRGGRVVLWASMATVVAGGAMKLLPLAGHLAGAIAQGTAAGYLAHVLGRALVDYLENGHDWGDGGLVALLDRIAARTDRKALTRGLTEVLRARLRPKGGRVDTSDPGA